MAVVFNGAMERRLANRPGWQRVLDRRFEIIYLQTQEYTGYVTRLYLGRVTEPLHKQIGERSYCLADAGYVWLQHFPEGAHHTLTTMFDPAGAVIQWYIDICADQGVDAAGIPWFEDLYLDIVVLPSGETVLLDADELEVARREGQISEGQYRLAWEECDRLLGLIAADAMPLLHLSLDHVQHFFVGQSDVAAT